MSLQSTPPSPGPEFNEKSLGVPERDVERGSSTATSITGDLVLGEKLAEEAPPRTVTGVVWVLVVISILSSTFLFALDNTVVADIQASVITDFGEIEKLSWLGIAFVLAGCATILPWGKAYGVFNAKWLYILSVFIFEVGSAVCGAAPNMNALIIGRAVAGLGGSGMYLGSLNLLSVTTTVHERPAYIGATGLTWGLGTVLGPVVGGAFSESSATWRWAFYINLLIGAVFAPVYLVLLPSADPQPNTPFVPRIKQLDWLGTILNIGSFVSLIMAINFGGTLYAWDSPQEIALFVVGGVLIIVFGVTQAYSVLTTPAQRLFPGEFLRDPFLVLLFAMMAAASTAIFVPTYYIPLYFQFVRGDTALEAAVRLLPFIIIMVVFCIVNGGAMSKTGYYAPWYLFGGAMVLIGGSLMYTVEETTSTAKVYGYTILIGIGSGSYIQASFSVAQAKVKPAQLASAVGYISLAQTGGIVIALAICGSVFLNESVKGITPFLEGVPAAAIKSAVAGSGSELFRSLEGETRQNVLHAIIKAMDKNYILLIVAGAMTVIGSLFMKWEKLFLEVGHAG
ncbi:major facilitator superfamily domain-containing protein [Tuber brumale]|nr:major facilitator superfamily domain-containing protein [Tuber brumale]